MSLGSIPQLPFQKHKRNIVWISNAVQIVAPKHHAITLSLGLCEVSKKVCFVALDQGMDQIRPLVVQDLYLGTKENDCEEQRRCLCFDCPRNKTTFTSFTRTFKWAKKAFPRKANFENFVELIRRSERDLQKVIKKIDWSEMHSVTVFKKPPIEIKVKPRTPA